ncbi:hypothetical protein K2173_005374 [Erythroxylum novogranatense]|uniref:Small auxin up regulated protein n=1 Tax=Erythroxylum novogranatense TaxID=1862640 RepID=A0AAV8TD15_9ROSI|nr:hypothetical protein K2173_005374 [Erythroxylum novogranatense]
MKRFRGLRLSRRKLTSVFQLMTRTGRKSFSFLNPISKVSALACWLQRGAKKCFSGSDPKYIQLGRGNPEVTPKGHLAVYMAESNGDTRRVLVPVIYFNHPLFGELLEESKRVYGYNHPGGITIPCDYSKFELVKMRIEDCRTRYLPTGPEYKLNSHNRC